MDDIGATKIMMSLSPHAHWDLLHRAGFGELSGSHFPGEVSGPPTRKRKCGGPSEVATFAYGYGLAVNNLTTRACLYYFCRRRRTAAIYRY